LILGKIKELPSPNIGAWGRGETKVDGKRYSNTEGNSPNEASRESYPARVGPTNCV